MHHVDLALVHRVDLVAHLRRDGERDALASAPVPDEDDPRVGRNGHGFRGVSGKREEDSPD
jgi:hypothetical protein